MEKSKKKTINELICRYARVYSDFEKLQNYEDGSILPIGDQKTGVIGEYYAKCFAETIYPTIRYANPGEPYDLVVVKNDKIDVRIQVKCVSAHFKTRTIAPLTMLRNGDDAFDELYLISLDKDFLPEGFYINSILDLKSRNQGQKTRRIGLKMKGENQIGSSFLDFSQNKVDELRKVIGL